LAPILLVDTIYTTKECYIHETNKINVEDFVEGNGQEAVFVCVPEISELQYFVTRIQTVIE